MFSLNTSLIAAACHAGLHAAPARPAMPAEVAVAALAFRVADQRIPPIEGGPGAELDCKQRDDPDRGRKGRVVDDAGQGDDQVASLLRGPTS